MKKSEPFVKPTKDGGCIYNINGHIRKFTKEEIEEMRKSVERRGGRPYVFYSGGQFNPPFTEY